MKKFSCGSKHTEVNGYTATAKRVCFIKYIKNHLESVSFWKLGARLWVINMGQSRRKLKICRTALRHYNDNWVMKATWENETVNQHYWSVYWTLAPGKLWFTHSYQTSLTQQRLYWRYSTSMGHFWVKYELNPLWICFMRASAHLLCTHFLQ